jgi:hypothetical protein
MAYHTGVVNAMSDLRAAIISALTAAAEGWTWDAANEVLYKSPVYARLTVPDAETLRIQGRTSATAGDAPRNPRIGKVNDVWTWPVNYEIFAFPFEVFISVNYNIEYYQFIAFGLSNLADALPGTGMWFSASLLEGSTSSGFDYHETGVRTSRSSPGLFFQTDGRYSDHITNYLHHALTSDAPWTASYPVSNYYQYDFLGAKSVYPLLGLLPNTWNDEAVLLPIRIINTLPEYKLNILAEIQNVRWTRNDWYAPGQIITIGADHWKILPMYRKNAAARTGGTALDHSGTFAHAVRYEGP